MIQASSSSPLGRYHSFAQEKKSPMQLIQEKMVGILNDAGVDLNELEQLDISIDTDGEITIDGLVNNSDEITTTVNENQELKELLTQNSTSDENISQWNQEAATLEISSEALEALDISMTAEIEESINSIKQNFGNGAPIFGNRGFMHSIFDELGMNKDVLSKILERDTKPIEDRDIKAYHKEIHDVAVKNRKETGEMISSVLSQNGILPIGEDEEIEISVNDDGDLVVNALGSMSSDRAKEIEDALNGSSEKHQIVTGMKVSSGLMELLTQSENDNGKRSSTDWVVPVDTKAVLSLLTEAVIGVSLDQFEDSNGEIPDDIAMSDTMSALFKGYENDMNKKIVSWDNAREKEQDEQPFSKEKVEEMVSTEKSSVLQNISSGAAETISTTFTYSDGTLKDERAEDLAKEAVKNANNAFLKIAGKSDIKSFTATVNSYGIIDG